MLFRRAEGLRYFIRPCEPTTIVVDVTHRGSRTALNREQCALLARLTSWASASELGVDASVLQWLVARDLVYFSSSAKPPGHVLGHAPLADPHGPVALRRNLRLRPLIVRGGVSALPFMPRVGTLDGEGAELAGIEARRRARRRSRPHADRLLREACRAGCARSCRGSDGRHTRSELGELVDLLDLVGLLENATPATWSHNSAQVTWIGHAGLLYEAGGQRVVIDPLFHAPSLPPRRPPGPGDDAPFDPRALGAVDAIFITHGDNDHLHPASLLRFDPHTPIYLPRAPRRFAYQVDLEGVARLLGFTNVHFCAEWETVKLGEVDIVAAPFAGEDWGLELPKRTYLVQHPSLTVYLTADAAFMPEVYRQVAARAPRLDLACLGVGGCAEPYASGAQYGYGDFYREWVPPEKTNEWIQHTASPEESAVAARLLGARRAFGYAVGASYMPMSYSDRGTHADLAAALAGSEVEAIALPLGRPVSAW